MELPDPFKFWSRVEAAGPDDCWLWAGGTDREGYGRTSFRRGGVRIFRMAHVLAWVFTHGPVPAGLLVRHVRDGCDRRCVNPRHLLPGTHQDNMNDMVRHGRSALGERNARCVLTEEQAVEAMRLVKAGFSHRAAGAKFGVSRQAVTDIMNGFRWWAVTGLPRKRLRKPEARLRPGEGDCDGQGPGDRGPEGAAGQGAEDLRRLPVDAAG